MKRVITLLLQAGIVLTAIAAILFAVRMIVQQALGAGSWYWGGAIASFLGPVALAAALFVFERCASRITTESPNA